jgi:hypothetical protein
MTGSWSVQVNAVRPFTIHGDIYWELHVTRLDGPAVELTLRVPQHAARTEPAAGQKLSVTFLMGQVTAVADLKS